jgi:hypothetical protein
LLFVLDLTCLAFYLILWRLITREFIERGGVSSGTVGQAQSYLLPARELVGFAIEKMEREYGTTTDD